MHFPENGQFEYGRLHISLFFLSTRCTSLRPTPTEDVHLSIRPPPSTPTRTVLLSVKSPDLRVSQRTGFIRSRESEQTRGFSCQAWSTTQHSPPVSDRPSLEIRLHHPHIKLKPETWRGKVPTFADTEASYCPSWNHQRPGRITCKINDWQAMATEETCMHAIVTALRQTGVHLPPTTWGGASFSL